MRTDLRELGITDAIGRPIHEGDFVTAVWAGGEVALFKVLGVKGESTTTTHTHTRLSPRIRRVFDANTLKLERTFKHGYKADTKVVYKTGEQVTWVDPEWVMLKFLNK